MGSRWTPEEVEKLKELYDAGYQLPVIAEMMGKNKNQIVNKISKSGMGNRRAEMLAATHLPKVKKVAEQIEVIEQIRPKRKFTEGAKIALGYYDNCVI